MKNWQIYNIFNKEDGLIAGSTNRDNTKNYNFSLALHTGEDRDKIEKNRAEFTSKFDSKFKFIYTPQS